MPGATRPHKTFSRRGKFARISVRRQVGASSGGHRHEGHLGGHRGSARCSSSSYLKKRTREGRAVGTLRRAETLNLISSYPKRKDE